MQVDSNLGSKPFPSGLKEELYHTVQQGDVPTVGLHVDTALVNKNAGQCELWTAQSTNLAVKQRSSARPQNLVHCATHNITRELFHKPGNQRSTSTSNVSPGAPPERKDPTNNPGLCYFFAQRSQSLTSPCRIKKSHAIVHFLTPPPHIRAPLAR